jgi:hypothetical protein
MQNPLPPTSGSASASSSGNRLMTSGLEVSRAPLAAASVLLAPSAFLTFAAMFGPSYFLAKIFELAGRNTVKYQGQMNQYIKDDSQFAGGITGAVEFLAGIGAKEFKKGFSMLAELIPAEERPNNSEEIEELYKGILRYNEKGEMVPSGNVKPFEVTNVVANQAGTNLAQSTSLHF